MVPLQSSKLSLLPSSSSSSSSSPLTTSLLFEPSSNSIALIHSDSSISLFPSLPSSPPSLPSLLPPKPRTSIPSPTSSSSFLLLHHHQDHLDPRVLFLVAGPHMGGSQIFLRFYIFQKRSNLFARPRQVVCTRKGLGFDPKVGVLLDLRHGVSVKIAASINFFVVYSVSSKKVWVFGVKLLGNGDCDDVLKLMRCAVIECCLPVWSISVSSEYLILGEDNGVRVFNLRHLVKGKVKKARSSSSTGNLEGKVFSMPNGVVGIDSLITSSLGKACNGVLDGKTDKHFGTAKYRSVRCKQESREGGASFVAFKSTVIEGLKPTKVRAISLQALSSQKFVILDSTGDLHVLCLSNPVGGSGIISVMRQLPKSMKVQKLAVFPDISSRNQTVWVSDGFYSVHMMTMSNTDVGVDEDNVVDNQEKLIQNSVVQAIFAAEKIQDLVPLGTNGILILGQGNIYAYASP